MRSEERQRGYDEGYRQALRDIASLDNSGGARSDIESVKRRLRLLEQRQRRMRQWAGALR